MGYSMCISVKALKVKEDLSIEPHVLFIQTQFIDLKSDTFLIEESGCVHSFAYKDIEQVLIEVLGVMDLYIVEALKSHKVKVDVLGAKVVQTNVPQQ